MKKKLFITVLVVLCVIVISTIVMLSKGIAPHTGIYLRAANGKHLAVVDNSPIVILNENENRFSSLQDGDRILIFYGNIDASFPSQAKINICLRLGKGDISDIPERTLQELKDSGWVSN